MDDTERLALPDAKIVYIDDFYSIEVANDLFRKLNREIEWRADQIKLFGRLHSIPRLHAFYGDQGLSYTYSKITNAALPWTTSLQGIRENLSLHLGRNFNSVLCNLYRSGLDSNGWHADDEKELGENPVIVSLSFGEPRDFQLKHRTSGHRHNIRLAHGSLLLMAGETQKNWLHCIPKRKRCTHPRINLTFRTIVD